MALMDYDLPPCLASACLPDPLDLMELDHACQVHVFGAERG